MYLSSHPEFANQFTLAVPRCNCIIWKLHWGSMAHLY